MMNINTVNYATLTVTRQHWQEAQCSKMCSRQHVKQTANVKIIQT